MAASVMRVSCPYCQQPAKNVGGRELYPYRPDLVGKRYWLCRPCGAWVGCHIANPKIGRGRDIPTGRLANAELRQAKAEAHAALDPLWQGSDAPLTRGQAYRWLSLALGVPKDEAHIGWLDVEQCRRIVSLVAEWQEVRRAA